MLWLWGPYEAGLSPRKGLRGTKRREGWYHGLYLHGIIDILQELGSWRLLLPILLEQVVLPRPPDDL